MEELKKRLEKLKKQIIQKGEDDKKKKDAVADALASTFPNKNPMIYIRDFYFRKDLLIIVAKNKSFSHELFIRRHKLLDLLKHEGIKDLKIQ